MPIKTLHPLYWVWQGMRRRCLTPTSKAWSDYGGRGIKICPEWDSFDQFIADMGPRPDGGYSLERIDNNGDYTPKNCKWATRLEQQRNQRTTRRVTIEGVVYLVCELASLTKLKHETIVQRAERGMTYEQVVAKRRYSFTGSVRKAIAVRVQNQRDAPSCKRGHLWTEENTYTNKIGHRACRACHRLKMRKRNAEKRASK